MLPQPAETGIIALLSLTVLPILHLPPASFLKPAALCTSSKPTPYRWRQECAVGPPCPHRRHRARGGRPPTAPHSSWLRRAGVGGRPLLLLVEPQVLGASVAAGREWSQEGRFLLWGGLCEHSGDALGHSARREGPRVPLSSDVSCHGCSPHPFPNSCQIALISAGLAGAKDNLSEIFIYFLA